jgi:glutaredoxin
METGTPYVLYKDAGNEKSNQKNYGTIKSSNLCCEIIEYSDHKEYACCTLASIALPTYVEEFDNSTINSIEVYTKSDCKFCNYSKSFLQTRGLSYTEHNLDDEIVRGDFFKELNKKSGGIECDGDNCRIVLKNKRFTSVPQIFINGEHVGGFAELYTYFKPTFNFKKLYDVTKVITRNLNKVIDLNFYPVLR